MSPSTLHPRKRLGWRDVPFVLGLLALVFSTANVVVQAQVGLSILSGPTISGVGETEAIISWSTDQEASTVVSFGTTTALGQVYRKIIPIEETEVMETRHVMKLSELTPGTTYYYKVRSVAVSGSGVESSPMAFATAAPPPTEPSVAPLTGVKLEPLAAAVFDVGMTVKSSAIVTGSARSVEFILKSAAGVVLQKFAGSASTDRWTVGLLPEPGNYALVVWAYGPAADGQEIIHVSNEVKFSVIAPPPPSLPEPQPTVPKVESEKPTAPTVQPVKTPPIEIPVAVSTSASETGSTEGSAAASVDGAADATVVTDDGTAETEAAPEELTNKPPDIAEPPMTGTAMTLDVYTGAIANLSIDEYLKQQATAVAIRAIADAAGALSDNETAADQACRASGVGTGRCLGWFAVRFANQECAAVGILTKEKCVDFLSEKNNGIFPGCEMLDAAACAQHQGLVLTAYMSTETKNQTDALVAAAVVAGEVIPLPELTSVAPDAAGDSVWYPSSVPAGTDGSPVVILPDADSDDVPDGMEAKYGTDPHRADTDGDGVTDGAEIAAGTNPLGAGSLDTIPDPAEVALLGGVPIEQPLASGEFDDNYRADFVGGISDGVVLEGTCAPSTTCLVYIYSYIPMVLTVATDAHGNWRYDLGNSVVDGSHTVYVALADVQGQVTHKSNPLALFIREAEAATIADFLRPDVVTTEGAIVNYSRYYVLGALLLVLLAGVAVAVIVLRPRREIVE